MALIKFDGVRTLGAAQTPRVAKAANLQTNPDYVVLDVALLSGGGVDAGRAVNAQAPDIVFIVFRSDQDQRHRQFYVAAGGCFFFDKSRELCLILNAIVEAKIIIIKKFFQ